MNNKQDMLNKIIDNCIQCCITKEGTQEEVKAKVLGKSRSITIIMTRCVCINQLLKAGFNVSTIAEALSKTKTSIRHLKNSSINFEKFSKAYVMALSEAHKLNQLLVAK